MPPELQQILNSQQQALQQAQFKMYLLGYSTYAAIIICAIFAALIFWKLCQIQKQLSARNPVGQLDLGQPVPPRAEPRSLSTSRTVQDDSRYMPKQ